MDEDCLYLNIFAPTDAIGNPDKYPVLAFLYGGVFNVNSPSTPF